MPARRGLATKGWTIPATIVHVRKVDCDTWDERIEQQMAVPVEATQAQSLDVTSIGLWVLSGASGLVAYLFKRELASKVSDKEVREIVRNILDTYHENVIMADRTVRDRNHEENQDWLRRIERKIDWKNDSGERNK